jgi:multidrug efflux pump subunit AcrA (membrane-fusion protein)
VFVAVGDRAERRIVTTGVEDDQGVEILSGINRGDLVITRGQAGLADGATINAEVRR